MIKKVFTKIKEVRPLEEIKKAKKEFSQTVITLILGGFSLVAALAWNEAIRSLFDTFFPKGQGLIGKFLYATIVTLIVVIFSMKLKEIISEKKE